MNILTQRLLLHQLQVTVDNVVIYSTLLMCLQTLSSSLSMRHGLEDNLCRNIWIMLSISRSRRKSHIQSDLLVSLMLMLLFFKVYFILNADKLPSSFQFSQYYKKGLEVVIMDGNMT